MDDIMITVVAWSMAGSLVIGMIGGWLVFVVAWVNDFFTTRTIPLPRWIRSEQQASRTSRVLKSTP